MKKIVLIFLILSLKVISSEAPGKPGIQPSWSSAKKVQVGTSYHDFKSSPKSLVWFSLANGVLTETYFPTIDNAQIKDSQILVLNKNGKLIDEKKSMIHDVENLSPSLVKLVNRSKDNTVEISHTYFTAKNSSTLIDEITIKVTTDGNRFFLLTNSALENSGLHDSVKIEKNNFKFYENDRSFYVGTNIGFRKMSTGFVGKSDGYQLLQNQKELLEYSFANNGNVAATGEFSLPKKKGIYKFYVYYKFDGIHSNLNFSKEKIEYESNWNKYFHQLKKVENPVDRDLFFRSMYVIRTHEDKLNPGAMIASLSIPWGEDVIHEENIKYGGYHLIWPRDLFHVSLAALYSGDQEVSLRALKFLKRIQYKEGAWNYGERIINKLGAFPQNVWTSGNEYWGGLQLDQVAYPVHLLFHLYKNAKKEEQKELLNEFKEMAILALDFIVNYGPWTGQERWEENFGISPSSFSAAAAALEMGTILFNNQKYRQVKNIWLNKEGDNIHTWTFTQNGYFGDGNYYIRIGGCENYIAAWDPNNRQNCIIANSGNMLEQTEILDQGFLKLSLFGLVKADDWRIQTSLNKINNNLRVQTPKGIGFYRYSQDAYGEEKKGRLWPLLGSEHGRYFLDLYNINHDYRYLDSARYFKNTFHQFKNKGHLIPEQIFETTGDGTGGATPLAWSHAEYIKMLWSIENKKNISNPF